MGISKNWSAEAISGTTGYEIIVRGEANVGMLSVEPELEKREPQGINPQILQLNLVNAGDAEPPNFRPVQYNEKLSTQDQYAQVEIFHNGNRIEKLPVKIV